MSRRSNKKREEERRKKKARQLLIGMVSGGVLLIALAVFFAFGGGRKDDGGTPVLSVDQEVIDYGDVKLATNLTFEIKVTNTGDGTLKFKEAPYLQVLEGC